MTNERGRAMAAWCAAAVVCAGGLTAQPAQAEPVIGSTVQPIIYGDDDRREVYASDERWSQLAHESVLALIPARNLVPQSDGSFFPVPGALGDVRLCPNSGPCVPVCADEPFVDEPSIADCSGVLVDDDLVLTAGHCFSGERSCAAYAYVFDYLYEQPGSLARIAAQDVYGCRRIVRRELSDQPGEEAHDYTLIQLDRPVDGSRKPVELRDELMGEGDQVVAIGFAIGLPAKVDVGGVVQEASKANHEFFTATTDTFVGNSGSAIFDADGRLAGHLVLGGQDFESSRYRGEQCLRSVVVPDGTRPPLYEHSVYVDVWRQPLCRSHWPSARLCGATGDNCGDGVCAGVETQDACGQDCDAPLCEGADCVHQAAKLLEFEGPSSSGGCNSRGAPAPGVLSWGLLGLWVLLGVVRRGRT